MLPDTVCYEDESIASGILEYPQYTKPYEYQGIKVPDVLLGGNHADISAWRRQKAIEETLKNRPELLTGNVLTKDDILFLEDLNK